MKKNYIVSLEKMFSYTDTHSVALYSQSGWDLRNVGPKGIVLGKDVDYIGSFEDIRGYVKVAQALVDFVADKESREFIYTRERGWIA